MSLANPTDPSEPHSIALLQAEVIVHTSANVREVGSFKCSEKISLKRIEPAKDQVQDKNVRILQLEYIRSRKGYVI